MKFNQIKNLAKLLKNLDVNKFLELMKLIYSKMIILLYTLKILKYLLQFKITLFFSLENQKQKVFTII